MAFTRAELVTLVKQFTGNRTNTSNLTDTWYQARITSAYRQLCTYQGPVQAPGLRVPQLRRLGFFELEHRQSRSLTTALTSTFITPSPSTDVCIVLDIFDDTHERGLDLRAKNELRRNSPTKTGIPRTWCPGGEGGVVGYYVDKIPSTSAEEIDVIEYVYKYPTALASDSTTPVIPDVWHIAIAYGAAAEAAQLLDMPEKKTEMDAQFMAFIAARKTPMEEASHAGRAGARRFTPIGTRR